MNTHTKVSLDKLKLLKALINLFGYTLLCIMLSILSVHNNLFLAIPFVGVIVFFMAVARLRLLNLQDSLTEANADDEEDKQ